VARSCAYFKISRSGYYAGCNRQTSAVLEESMVLDLVHEIRHVMPRIGGKKMYNMLSQELHSIGKIGRDKFFDILRRNNLLVKRKKSFTRTTDSYHRFRVYKNLLYNKTLTRSNECYVSDITYLRTDNGFVYLFLLTDAYSRKIVGWDLSRSLAIEGGLKALGMALRQRKTSGPLIHHSDRGIQYCCNAYVKRLKKHKVHISMTEENHCYENSLAERVNGILKDEFLLDSTFKNYKQALRATRQAIETYNELRPHWSLDLKTPNEVHLSNAA
jgi:transposase InsO family protein